jgi:Uma2 family endonuclease
VGLSELARRDKLGLYLIQGALLSNLEADIAGKPDGLFLSTATLASDRVQFIEDEDGGCVELQGSPDMVLEVVSTSSEDKDNDILKEAYHRAGIPEYWLVDARRKLRFDIFRHTPRGYVATRQQDDWIRSGVFGRSFRLLVETAPDGHPDYTLEVR